jgi:hypothetical protein
VCQPSDTPVWGFRTPTEESRGLLTAELALAADLPPVLPRQRALPGKSGCCYCCCCCCCLTKSAMLDRNLFSRCAKLTCQCEAAREGSLATARRAAASWHNSKVNCAGKAGALQCGDKESGINESDGQLLSCSRGCGELVQALIPAANDALGLGRLQGAAGGVLPAPLLWECCQQASR